MHQFMEAVKESIRDRTARVHVGAEVPGEGPWAWGAGVGVPGLVARLRLPRRPLPRPGGQIRCWSA